MKKERKRSAFLAFGVVVGATFRCGLLSSGPDPRRTESSREEPVAESAPFLSDANIALDVRDHLSSEVFDRRAVAQGFQPTLTGELYGRFAIGDAIRITWSGPGGKIRAHCPLRSPGGNDFPSHEVQCMPKRGAYFKVAGTYTGAVSLWRVATEKETPLRTVQLTVKRAVRVVEGYGTKPYMGYVARFDEMLGSSLIWLVSQTERRGNRAHTARRAYKTRAQPQSADDERGEVRIYFWTTNGAGHQLESSGILRDVVFKCSVNGRAIEQNLVGAPFFRVVKTIRMTESVSDSMSPRSYDLTKVVLFPSLIWGKAPSENVVSVTERSGRWHCQLRTPEKLVREFRWTVGGGEISAPNERGLHLPRGRFLIETYFPKRNMFDDYFDANAIRRAGFFGHKWSLGALAEMHRALPASHAVEPFPVGRLTKSRPQPKEKQSAERARSRPKRSARR
ncbi:MAG: hypothetical protein HYY84_15855 [Deltaproteobacteria bacterium]|nr:hypothetical protein [Deltaproteobacteria bacterium]